MNLKNINEIVTRLDDQSRLAESHYANAVDAQHQIRSRHELLRQSVEQIDRQEYGSARASIDAALGACPSAENVQQWFEQSREMLDQASRTRGELREAVEKMREMEDTRVRHGGLA